ncbi:unnamed protein product, partial [Clonostachys rosea f. rosea IK726]
MGSRLQIKVPQQTSKEQPHLRVGQAGSLFLGPSENGLCASFLSSAYRGSFSHRSGAKESGSRKFEGDVKAAKWETPTLVYTK